MTYSDNLPVVHLHIGHVIITQKSIVIRTILGSCVSVVMWIPSEKVGMMSHSIYPGLGSDCRYTVNAVKTMNEEVAREGLFSRDVTVKLFGGGVQKSSSGIIEMSPNVRSAENELSLLGYRVVKADTGGNYHRKILFNTDTGDVFQKKTIYQIITDQYGE